MTAPAPTHRRPSRRGTIRSRRRGVWEVRTALPPDPATGRRRQRSTTVYGDRRAAVAALARLANTTAPSTGDRRAGTTRDFMQGDAAIIELLNDVLTAELTAINQYFVDAKMFDNWGIKALCKHFYDASIDEMKDADNLIERLL